MPLIKTVWGSFVPSGSQVKQPCICYSCCASQARLGPIVVSVWCKHTCICKMLESLERYLCNAAGDLAQAGWVWQMQTAEHYSHLHALMPVFLFLTSLASGTIHSQRHTDKSCKPMSCLPAFPCEITSHLLFLLECRTRWQRSTGTNCAFLSFEAFRLVFTR